MKRTLIVVAAVVGFATAASAATLTVTSDQATYNVGETITLTVVGDAEGGASSGIFVALTYDTGPADVIGSSQQALTSFTGGLTWVTGNLAVSTDDSIGVVAVADQVAGLGALAPDGPLNATATLVATAAGLVNASFSGAPGSPLNFFGITTAGDPGITNTSFTIVPEPTTAALLGLGLFGLSLAGRRRS